VTGARQVPAHDRLDGDRPQTTHDHRPAPDLLGFVGGHHGFGRNAGEVVGHDLAQAIEPEERQRVEHPALVRDGLAHDHIEG
jgi:hypothetical protein